VVGDDGVSEVQLRDRVAQALRNEKDAEVITGTELAKQNQDAIHKALSGFNSVLLAFALISVAVGAFVIYTSFSFIVAQRQRQFALLRAVGARRTQVLRTVLVEGLAVGIIASVAGYIGGVGLAIVMRAAFSAIGISPPSNGVVIKPANAIGAVLVGIVITVFSSFYPAWRASRVPPLAALRDVALDRAGRSRIRLALGLGILALGIGALVSGLNGGGLARTGLGVFLTFAAFVVLGPVAARPASLILGWPLPALRGVTGRMARENAARNPKRTSSTASALMIGMGVVTFFLVLNSSIRASIGELVDKQFRGDFVVDSNAGFQGGLPPQVASDLNQVPEVSAASGIRFTFVKVGKGSTTLTGVNPATAFKLFNVGVAAGNPADLDKTGLAVYAPTAKKKGWTIGSPVKVTFVQGGETTLRVRALLDRKDLLGEYVVGYPAYNANVSNPTDVQVWVQLKPGVSVEQARPAIKQVVARFPTAKLEDVSEFKKAQSDQFQPILILLLVLVAVTIVVATIGILNTLILSVIERTREIGLVRAIGSTRVQVRSTIRWEAVIIGLFGLGAALTVGTFFGWALVRALSDEGFTAFRVPLLQMVILGIVTLLLTLVASVIPAWWAGRRNVLQAISTD